MKITNSAIEKLNSILSPDEWFRVKIRAGGCNGLEYLFEKTKLVDKFDTIYDDEKVRVVVDKKSAVVLTDATLDWSKDLLGSKFVISFDNAKKICSCGSSFSL